MGPLRYGLFAGMLSVALAAVNLYALSLVLSPGPLPPQARYFVLSVLPMANLVALAGYRRARGGRLRPFIIGFLTVGVVALVAQVGLQAYYPPVRRAYDGAARSLLYYCEYYSIPGTIVTRGDGTQFFLYAPALGLIFWLPQFLAGLLGGILTSWGSRLGGRQSTA